MIRNIEQAIEGTFIQLAECVIVSKLSGYSHSVWGHGRQQVMSPTVEQNLPEVTKTIVSYEVSN